MRGQGLRRPSFRSRNGQLVTPLNGQLAPFCTTCMLYMGQCPSRRDCLALRRCLEVDVLQHYRSRGNFLPRMFQVALCPLKCICVASVSFDGRFQTFLRGEETARA